MMQQLVLTINRARPGFFLALIMTIFSMYLATYSATFQSQDTVRIYDAASSFALFGDLGRDETLYRDPPEIFSYLDTYPLTSHEPGEPLMPILVSMLYRIVYVIPSVGLIHGTWLFNTMICAVICGVFWKYSISQGFSDRTSLTATFLLGFATILWVYSKTLFREPLIALFLMTIFLVIEGSRGSRIVLRFGLLGVAGALCLAAFLTKNSVAMAFPGLLILLVPSIRMPRRIGYLLDILLLLFVMAFLGVVSSSVLYEFVIHTMVSILNTAQYLIGGAGGSVIQSIIANIQMNAAYSESALSAYVLSIGGSIWGSSPVILLGIPGIPLLIQRGYRRIAWAIVMVAVAYILGHALLTGQHWFGGVSWPPRFLVPIIPLLMITTLPVIEWFVHIGFRSFFAIMLAVLFIGYSVVIQIVGTVSLLLAYGSFLPEEAGGLYEWGGGLNDLRYLRWVVLPHSWGSLGLDVAWSRVHAEYIGMIFMIIAALGIFFLWNWDKKAIYRSFFFILPVALIMNLGFGLSLLYERDHMYDAQKVALHEVLSILAADAENGVPLILEGDADVTYERFIMNYNRVNTIRPIVIGFPPGEAASEDVSPQVRSDFPPSLLVTYEPLNILQPRTIDFLARHHERIWFLAHNSKYLPWSIRPVEQYLNQNYYLLREVTTDDPTVRLLEYSTIPAPNRYDLRLPEALTETIFEDQIALFGFTLPRGTNYQAGDVVSISLMWVANEKPSKDIVVAWFLVKDDYAIPPIQGLDTMPDGNFQPTSGWQPGVPVWDNHAIELPANTPPGTYQIWLVLYEAGSGGALRFEVTSGETTDDNISILPVVITVDP